MIEGAVTGVGDWQVISSTIRKVANDIFFGWAFFSTVDAEKNVYSGIFWKNIPHDEPMIVVVDVTHREVEFDREGYIKMPFEYDPLYSVVPFNVAPDSHITRHGMFHYAQQEALRLLASCSPQ